jgi:hypothetical protein
VVVGELAIRWERLGGSCDGVLRLRVYLLLLYEASSLAAADEVFFGRNFGRVVIIVIAIRDRSNI